MVRAQSVTPRAKSPALRGGYLVQNMKRAILKAISDWTLG